MGLLQKLKSTLGLSDSRSGRGSRGREVDVTVEHEPNTESEGAVKGTSPPDAPRAPQSAASSSTAEADDESADDADAASDATDAANETDEASAPETDATDEGSESSAGHDESVTELNGIGPAYGERLGDAGVDSVGDLATADAADLAERTGLGEGRVESWIEQAREY